MLTREQAKTKECPLRAAGFWANANDNMSPGEGVLNCRAEDCPKWHDYEFGSGFLCPEERDYIGTYHREMPSGVIRECREKHRIDACKDCPGRFGYCGG